MVCCSVVNVYADDTDSYISSDVTVANLYTNGITTNLYKSNSTMKYYCNVNGKSTATKIYIYLYLQEYSNGTWKDISAISKTVSDRTAYVSNTCSSVVSGKKYRTNAHVYVYSGSKYEYLEVNSANLIF
jgi:hypothetical protein